ncbi:hypothetical protein TanjilG_14292 [Lupinus angustifolius]|uniref:Homeobox domain-containing protein n=1 Tax=Lupinus angustifolius TaxID=3871 RepID=A0A1J7G0U6_LUPAN|nr:PREDICTED: homeobox-leucine zipper protein HAT22-like [Lupinus angustifolius]OIV94045.1 hypothetical protein TanjilG_14292 [Lupinus angustifolius]
MAHDHDASISGLHLVLGLALTSTTQKETFTPSPQSNKVVDDHFSLIRTTSKKPYYEDEPSLTLGLSGESYQFNQVPLDLSTQTSPLSVVSSFSSGRVKRERELSSEEVEATEIEIERVSSRISDEDEDGTNVRKKLRLNKEQSALLEESFKQHSTLNPKQKQALAKHLNLLPRQVEVWFQNRRARTKLKQTEVDYEFLKKCCETLKDENMRLQKELQEMKALKLAQSVYMPMPTATLTMCPSCERLNHGVSGGSSNKSTPFSMSMAPKPHFYNPYTNPSAAC